MRALSILLLSVAIGCAAPLRSNVAPFRSPESLPNAKRFGDLVIAADILDTPEKSERVFGTDLATAHILPVHLIVSNKGSHEYVIEASQIFAEFNGESYPAYNLSQAAERVRESSIGSTVATQAAVGALVLGAAGAAAGAGIGYAAGNTGAGAAAGAAVGTSTGAVGGAAFGASDKWTRQFRHELAIQDFGSKNIYGGDIYRGFIYFQRQPYKVIRVKLTNVTERKTEIIELPAR